MFNKVASRAKQTMPDEALIHSIMLELLAIEADGDVVICTANPAKVAQRICEAVQQVVPQTGLTASELTSVRSLIESVAKHPDFFDRDLVDETGLNADEALQIASKLPNGF